MDDYQEAPVANHMKGQEIDVSGSKYWKRRGDGMDLRSDARYTFQ